MVSSAPAKALALLLFLSAVGAATYGTYQYSRDDIEEGVERARRAFSDRQVAERLEVEAPRGSLQVTPGHNVTFLVTIENTDQVARDLVLEVDGLVSARSPTTRLRANTTQGFFLTGAVPADAPLGPHALELRVIHDERTVLTNGSLLAIDVLGEGPGLGEGELGYVRFVGRLAATGAVFVTNEPALVGLVVPRTDNYQFVNGDVPVPNRAFPIGVHQGVVGMQVGESRTLTFGPDVGFGPEVDTRRIPREQAFEREVVTRNSTGNLTIQEWVDVIVSTRQGRPQDYNVGSTFRLYQGANSLPYIITNTSSTHVFFRPALRAGDVITYPLTPWWQNATTVTSANETEIVFNTTPNTAVGEMFTAIDVWPEMTALRSYNDTHIIVRHTPVVGTRWTETPAPGVTVNAVVQEVTEDAIVIGYPSSNALAGRDLAYDVTLLSIGPPV